MRILDQKGISSVASSRTGRTSSANSARFTLDAGASSLTKMETQAPISMLGNLEALIAIQSGENSREKRSRKTKQGFRVLDLLDELKLSLLGGKLPPDLQSRLRSALQEEGATDDPRLNSLMEGIELRAEVELAKLRQAKLG